MQYHRFALIAFVAATALPLQAQEQVSLVAVKDNTLYESASGSLSNGAGDFIFAGNTGGGQVRRAIVAFDVSTIPAGAVIEGVVLTLNMSKEPISGPEVTIALHRLTADWGEGTSHAGGEEGGGGASATGDATWTHRFFNSDTWQIPGGDYVTASSASAQVDAVNSYTWGPTDLMISDVKGWVDDAGSNFGWILIGNESANSTAKRFDSSENGTAVNRPTLVVRYSTGVAVEEVAPTALRLRKNYPDPFSDASIIPFEIDAPSRVRIDVYDVLGRIVSTLVDGTLAAGPHEVEVSSTGMTNGLYAYCFQSNSGRECRTMVVTR